MLYEFYFTKLLTRSLSTAPLSISLFRLFVDVLARFLFLQT